ncbi:MAG: hypothetical protein KJO05_00465 [Bacteroidia bacterium]|jgi:hypothetical protein|nr:hypothetical protein [Bacteroidia bacterium]NNF30824.1 hypothetical protein [Flavobacteriaceae bacterium]NNK54437.1 hypothetical protein [Flavobacteriaceae bacterium]
MIYKATINGQNIVIYLDGSMFYNGTTKQELTPYVREDGIEVIDIGDIQLPVEGVLATARKEMGMED